jgi:hypothetical protein
LHGICKKEFNNTGCSEWGQYKHGKAEGYLTTKFADGRVDYYQYKNGEENGYGILTNNVGEVYRGEFKDGIVNGYGFFKYENKDEYYG